jgi:hypothetical protein
MGDNSEIRVLVLATADDLQRTYDAASWVGRSRVDHVLVALPWVGEPERSAVARRVRRYHNDCGCRMGELVLGVAVLVLWLAPPALHVARPGWPSVVLLLVLAAVGGKLLGLAWSRRQLKGELRRLGDGARTESGGGRDGRNRVP